VRRNRVLLAAVGGTLLVLLVWFLFFWGPQGNRLSDARERKEAAESENQRLQLERDRLQAAQERVPELAARLEQLRVAVPEQPNLAQFILDANDAAERSGINFISISPSPPTAGETVGPSAIALSINISGGYFQLLDFLNRLEAMPRIVVVDNLTLSPAGGESPGDLSGSVTARMFTTATPESVAAGGAPGGAEEDTTTTSTTVAGGGDTTTTTATTTPGGENP